MRVVAATEGTDNVHAQDEGTVDHGEDRGEGQQRGLLEEARLSLLNAQTALLKEQAAYYEAQAEKACAEADVALLKKTHLQKMLDDPRTSRLLRELGRSELVRDIRKAREESKRNKNRSKFNHSRGRSSQGSRVEPRDTTRGPGSGTASSPKA